MSKSPVGVIGLGNWGTALANHLALAGHQVSAWTRDEEVVVSVNKDHFNSLYLKEIKLDPKLQATSSLKEVCALPLVVLAIPSSALAEVLKETKFNQDQVLVSAIKGIDPVSSMTPLQLVSSLIIPTPKLGVISGPGFAKDIVAQYPAGLVAGSKDLEIAKMIAEIFSSESLRLYVSEDPLGVELGGILKNVIAIAAGISDGLGLGDSARSGVVTRGLAEMLRLALALGAKQETLFGLSGLGDLVLTCTCDASRNRTVGLRLGQGEKLATIVSSLGSHAEGVKTTPLVVNLARKNSVEMPIAEAVNQILRDEISPKEALRQLFNRPIKSEFYTT